MMLRIRGHLSGYYVGRSTERLGPSVVTNAEHFRVELYRAIFECAERHEVAADDPFSIDPDAAAPLAQTSSFRQARITQARVLGADARGRVFEGALLNVHVAAPRLQHPTRHDGAIYGLLEGQASAYVLLPDEPTAAELVPLREVESPLPEKPVQSAAASSAPAQQELAPGDTMHVAPLSVPSAESLDDRAGDSEEPEGLAPTETAQGTEARRLTAPLLSASALVGLALWITGDGAVAAIWLTITLPTLFFRRLLHEVLEDTVGVRVFAGVLLLAQLLCTVSPLLNWWTDGCNQAHLGAIVGGVSSLFLAGLLPWAWPVTLQGLAFALVLWASTHVVGEPCAKLEPDPARPNAHAPRSPRTNDDGSWPRRHAPPRDPSN